MDFKLLHTFETRCSKVSQLKLQYPSKCFIILSTKESDIEINIFKFICQKDVTVSQFVNNLLEKNIIKGDSLDALYIATDKNVILSPAMKLYTVEQRYKDDDGFIYLCLYKESSFG